MGSLTCSAEPLVQRGNWAAEGAWCPGEPRGRFVSTEAGGGGRVTASQPLASNGSTRRKSHSSKSRRLRVATAAPKVRAMAAI